MKSCTNCHAIYADDYNGTCADCGAGMGGQTSNDQSLRMKWASQVSSWGSEGSNPRNVAPSAGLVEQIRNRVLEGAPRE